MAATTVYLGIGTNLGDRKKNLDRALELLSTVMTLESVSSIYETEPMGKTDQPKFLNLVCRVHTLLSPLELLTLAKGIEIKMGRVFGELNGPRPIDIDILLYGDLIMDTPRLTIPHPRITEREFVLVPLAEIAGDLLHPKAGKRISVLKDELKEDQGVRFWEKGVVED